MTDSISLWYSVCSNFLFLSDLGSWFGEFIYFILYLTILCTSVGLVLISTLSFLILFISALSFSLPPLFLMSLAKSLSILLIFSKNQLLVSLI